MDIAVVLTAVLAAVLLLACGVGVIINVASARRRSQSLPGQPETSAQPGAQGRLGPQVAVSEDALERVRALLGEGKKISAIKELRTATGIGLKDAKDAVEAMEAGRPTPLVVADALGGSLAARARALKEGGEFSRAVVLVRGETGMSEAEAQEFVTVLTESDAQSSP